jgi:hypothetical protein
MNAHPEASPRAPERRRRAFTRVLACALAVVAGALGACSDLPLDPEARPGGGPSLALYNNPLCQAPAGQTHPADTITATQHWYPSGNPHWVTGDIRVDNGAQLRIHPGTIVCFDQFVEVVADGGGRVAVDGDDTARVVLTALHPDYGWDGVALHGTPASNSFMHHALVEYARGGAAVYAGDNHMVVLDSVHVRQSGNAALLYSRGSRILRSVVDTTTWVAVVLGDSTRFTETTVRGAGWMGVYVVAQSGVQLLGGRIEGSALAGLLVDNAGAVMVADPIRITGGATYPIDAPLDVLGRLYNTLAEQDSLLGNARDTAYVGAGTLDVNLYAISALPWRVTGHLTVSTGGKLWIQPGAALAFEAPWGITARDGGRLLARGSAAAPVRLGPVDSVYGWAGIQLEDAPAGPSYLTNARVDYTRSTSALVARDSHTVVIDSTVFRRVAQAAALLSPGSVIRHSRVDSTTTTGMAAVELAADATLSSTLIRGAMDTGIHLHTSTAEVISCEVRDGGGDAINVAASGGAEVRNCNLVNNAGYGVLGGATLSDVEDIWWGDAAGPFGASGDGASGALDYTPWRTTPYTLPYVP